MSNITSTPPTNKSLRKEVEVQANISDITSSPETASNQPDNFGLDQLKKEGKSVTRGNKRQRAEEPTAHTSFESWNRHPSLLIGPQIQPHVLYLHQQHQQHHQQQPQHPMSYYLEQRLITDTAGPLSELPRPNGSDGANMYQPQQLRQHKSQVDSQFSIQPDTISPPSSKRRAIDLSQKDNYAVPEEPLPLPQTRLQLQLSSDEIVRRVRAEMPNWSVAEVVAFVESHDDIKQYAPKFAESEVDGQALLLMIDRNLDIRTLATMFKYGPAMKIEAILSNYKAKH